MIDPKKQYRTREGQEVRIYAVDGGVFRDIVHGAIYFDDIRNGQGWRAAEWTLHGCYNSNNLGHDRDLIEVRPRIKREVWVNMYPDVAECFYYTTKQRADEGAVPNRIACVKLTIDCEEGEGL